MNAALVIADLPPLGPAAAAEAGVPSLAIGNFTWDWIYEGYKPEDRGLPGLVPLVREATGRASAFVRLPMWGGFEMAPPDRTYDVPLVARRSKRKPAETRQALGLPLDRRSCSCRSAATG